MTCWVKFTAKISRTQMVQASVITDFSEANPGNNFHLSCTGTVAVEANNNGNFQMVNLVKSLSNKLTRRIWYTMCSENCLFAGIVYKHYGNAAWETNGRFGKNEREQTLRKEGSSLPLLCGHLPVNGDPNSQCSPLHPTPTTSSPVSASMPGMEAASNGCRVWC